MTYGYRARMIGSLPGRLFGVPYVCPDALELSCLHRGYPEQVDLQGVHAVRPLQRLTHWRRCLVCPVSFRR